MEVYCRRRHDSNATGAQILMLHGTDCARRLGETKTSCSAAADDRD